MNRLLKKVIKKLPFLNLFNILKNRNYLRSYASYKYIKGKGIEIGALHNPLKHSELYANVKYVDRLSVVELRKHYPELNNYDLVNVDIIDDGEYLNTIPDNSLDFIIANHMLEHCKDPINTIHNHITKVKPGGIIYYAIPDKKYTRDKKRPLTSFEHLIEDYLQKTEQLPHYMEWCQHWGTFTKKNEIIGEANHLLQIGYSIHFHTWTAESFLDFINKVKRFNSQTNLYQIEFFAKNRSEVIVILKKI